VRAVCHVSLQALVNNYSFFHSLAPAAAVIPVVKADAYGHGAIPVTKCLVKEFSTSLVAVATLEEAQSLAPSFPELAILILSRVFPDELSALPKTAILTITSLEDWAALKTAAKGKLKAHINVNTGMNRLGVPPEAALELIRQSVSSIEITGVYTHFSSSDSPAKQVFDLQKSIFNQFCSALNSLGFSGLRHEANSAGLLSDSAVALDAVRLGIGLYGYDTSSQRRFAGHLEPVMTVQAPLVRIETIEPGQSVSYGETWTAAVTTQVGTLRIGYADGYPRALSNRGFVTFENQIFPVIGTVTMDHIMLDLKNSRLPSGSYLTVFGGTGESTGIAAIANKLKTIPYEICCGISPRVSRVYYD